MPLASVATTATCSEVTPCGGVPLNWRSPGENFNQSGNGVPPAVVADTCTGVVATLCVNVLSGRVSVNAVPAGTRRGSNVRTAANPGPEAAAEPSEDAVLAGTGVTVPVGTKATVRVDVLEAEAPEVAPLEAVAALLEVVPTEPEVPVEAAVVPADAVPLD